MKPITIQPENALKIDEWIRTRNGIAIWESVSLSDPGFSLTTPVVTAEGVPMPRPHWKVASAPARIITDPAEVLVSAPKEVKRFHVAVRRGSQGLSLKVTDGGTRRIRAAVDKAGDGAYYVFDYSTQEAVIMVPGVLTPLLEYVKMIKG